MLVAVDTQLARNEGEGPHLISTDNRFDNLRVEHFELDFVSGLANLNVAVQVASVQFRPQAKHMARLRPASGLRRSSGSYRKRGKVTISVVRWPPRHRVYTKVYGGRQSVQTHNHTIVAVNLHNFKLKLENSDIREGRRTKSHRNDFSSTLYKNELRVVSMIYHYRLEATDRYGANSTSRLRSYASVNPLNWLGTHWHSISPKLNLFHQVLVHAHIICASSSAGRI